MVAARIDERSSPDDSSQSMTALDANEAFLQLAQIRRYEVASLNGANFELKRRAGRDRRGLRLLHGRQPSRGTLNAAGGRPVAQLRGLAGPSLAPSG